LGKTGDAGPVAQPAPSVVSAALQDGCYLINFTPADGGLRTYDGTLRIDRFGGGGAASGDLYQRPIVTSADTAAEPALPSGPAPGTDIPIFPRSQYRYYLRVTRLDAVDSTSVKLAFEMWRYVPSNRWSKETELTASMSRKGSAAYSSGAYYEGDLASATSANAGRFSMGWISPSLRKASIQVNRVADSETPMANSTGMNWRDIFASIRWDGAAFVNDALPSTPPAETWTDAELHAAMLTLRGKVDLDSEWRYHIMAVHRLASTDRGIMYDAGGTDSDNVPREGIGIASHWIVPNEDPWGLVKGQRVGLVSDVYFRTAVHEIGHALGLFHNSVDNGFMATTDRIASRGTDTTPFPKNVVWSFAPDDQRRLKHYPDLFVRPGGIPFGDASDNAFPSNMDDDREIDTPGLTLRTSPLLETVPIGSPVRVLVELRNDGPLPVPAPPKLNMKSGRVAGRVVDPGGVARSFRPLFVCLEDERFVPLGHGESVTHALTLLRGADGALFPSVGLYRIIVEVSWEAEGLHRSLSSESSVFVMPPVDEKQALTAKMLLTTPDAHLTLVLGGDHLPDGVQVIKAAIENPVLRPHYAYVEARRLMERFMQRKPDLRKAATLIQVDTVMSPAEIQRTAETVRSNAAFDEDDESAAAIGRVLRQKIAGAPVPEKVVRAVNLLGSR
jgi:hypothetical protein